MDLLKKNNSLQKVDVFLIEDDLGIKDALSWFINLLGYSIAMVSNGEHALEELKYNISPSVIILDLMMPGMDGFAFREEQAKSVILKNIPTIIMSASTKTDALVMQENEVLIKKPLNTQILLTYLKKYINNHQN
ncbi:response regulator [Legionella sp. WA2024007413]